MACALSVSAFFVLLASTAAPARAARTNYAAEHAVLVEEASGDESMAEVEEFGASEDEENQRWSYPTVSGGPRAVPPVRGSRPQPPVTRPTATGQSAADFAADDDETALTGTGLLKRERYIATNRFAVKPGKEAKFEKRWATRKSSLAKLEGFRHFHLMRRVTLGEDGSSPYDAGDKKNGTIMGNYVSFTVWQKKSHFSAWRKGEAFKEAHGGTSLWAFVTTLIGSARVLRGAPRPAFYDGLLVQSVVPDSIPETVDGWRNVKADGKTLLPAECFVACNQFYVPKENGAAFEKRWADRETKLKECDGFVAFFMLRRDGKIGGHGTVPMADDEPSYVSTTIWRDRKAFDGWRNGMAFQQAHGQSPSPQPETKDGETKDGEPPKGPPQPLWSRPPVPVFYEGTLVISTEEGA